MSENVNAIKFVNIVAELSYIKWKDWGEQGRESDRNSRQWNTVDMFWVVTINVLDWDVCGVVLVSHNDPSLASPPMEESFWQTAVASKNYTTQRVFLGGRWDSRR